MRLAFVLESHILLIILDGIESILVKQRQEEVAEPLIILDGIERKCQRVIHRDHTVKIILDGIERLYRLLQTNGLEK